MRRSVAVAAAKVAAGLSRRFRLGGGTALPGLVAERIDPEIIVGLASRLGQGSVLVTGTNGKTTTARLVRRIVHTAGMETVANRAGSNMMRGIASSLVESADWGGEIEASSNKLGVFEVDEATVPEAAWSVRPRVALFTNLFRDQLDRYGEVEYVADVWRKAVAAWPKVAVLILNADDPSVASLGKHATGPVVYYGLEDVGQGVEAIEHAADARWCTSCGAELTYAAVFYGHLGHWRCKACGNERPKPDVSVVGLTAGREGMQLILKLPEGQTVLATQLTGLYNAYNVLAAAACAAALGIRKPAIEQGLATFTAAFGRQEGLTVGGREVQVILAKNPAGLNQVLRTIRGAEGEERDVIFFLNDDIADGRDISWIWDVDFELLAGNTRAVTASGRRAWDMALRLKYAGLEPVLRVEPEPGAALAAALRETPGGRTLYVIPTYTAMLQVRDILARKAGRGAFWEEAGDG